MKGYLIVVFILLCQLVSAQNPPDSTLANNEYERAYENFKNYKYDSARQLYLDAKQLYKELGDPIKIIGCEVKIIECYWRVGEFDTAIQRSNEILPFIRKEAGENSAWEGTVTNSIGSSYLLQGSFEDAVIFYKQTLNIYRSLDRPEKVADALYNLGNTYTYLGDYDSATVSFEKSLAIEKEVFAHDSVRLGDAYMGIGTLYYAKGFYEKALDNFERSFDLIIDKPDNEFILSPLLNNLAVLLNESGQYRKAIDYLNKSTEIYRSVHGENNIKLVNTLSNMASSMWYMEEYDSAIILYKKALNMLDVIDFKDDQVKAKTFNSIGLALQEQGKEKESLEYFHLALDTQKKANPNNPVLAKYYISVGTGLINANQIDEGRNYNLKAIELYKKHFGERYFELPYAYNALAEIKFKQKKYSEALKLIQEAFASGTYHFTSQTLYDHPSEDDAIRNDVLLITTMAKIKVLTNYYADYKQKNVADETIKTFEFGDQLLDYIRRTSPKTEDKINFRKKAKTLYEKAIAHCLSAFENSNDRHYLEKAFYFSEKSKASTLIDALNNLNAQDFGGVPQALLTQEKELRLNISFYKSVLNDEKLKTENIDHTKIKNYEDKLFLYENEQETLIESLEQNYREYFELKYSNAVGTVQDIQSRLNNTLLCSYFVGDENTYLFAVTDDFFDIIRIVDNQILREASLGIREVMDFQAFSKNRGQSFKNYIHHASLLYNKILRPVLERIKSEKLDNLMIIPDGELSYIPFELLLTNPEKPSSINYRNLPYLIKKINISYAYSATLQFNFDDKRKNTSTDYDYLSFAPVYTTGSDDLIAQNRTGKFRDAISPLKWNTSEAEGLGNYLSGRSYTANKATERTFKENANNSKILHLAMHAFVDNDDPAYSKLVFTQDEDSIEDGFLYTYELYNMNLDADLAVLSACNTGYGKLVQGEGVMSLARGFSYAGVPSVVMSHWSVDDQTTSKLMELFYANLSEGLTRTEALRNAKLDFLKTSSSSTVHPFFWGAFVLIGDNGTIQIENSTWKKVIGLLSTLLFFVSVFLLVQGRSRK